MYNIKKIREDFPILSRRIYGKPLIYFDNAATTQKPLSVLDVMRDEYLNVNSNVHRGVHWMSQQATDLYENARETVRQFINAKSATEIVFTRGTTEGLNLVASCFCSAFMQKGDEVIVSTMEHHSNIVPWQLLSQRYGIVLKVIPISDEGELDIDAFKLLITDKTKLVSLTHVSNVMGIVNPINDIIKIAHSIDIPVMIDGAQSTPHFAIDVQLLDCDFFAFSGHKLYGPTGIGVLYGKEKWLDKLPPYQGGGEMIEKVSFEGTSFERPPLKFEAGTPDYIAANGLAKAIDYLTSLGMENINNYEHNLLSYAIEQIKNVPKIRLFGITAGNVNSNKHDAVISFLVSNIHHMDIGTLLDQLGIAVRTGHHCAQPLMERLGITGTVRASFALYNTKDEIDSFISGLERIIKMF